MNKITFLSCKLLLVLLTSQLFAAEASSTQATMTISKVSTETKQSNKTPKQVLQALKEGNQRFLSGNMHQRNYIKQAKLSSHGQFPSAVILNCMDSRSVPEIFLDQGISDLFIVRVAGNVLNEDILGSIEYATKVVGSRLVVVLGHTSCGAVSGACTDVRLGHLDSVLDKIKPSILPAQKIAGTKDCSKPELIDEIAKNNALRMAREIKQQSPIIQQLIQQGQVGIVAGLHDIKTGKVTFFEEGRLIPAGKN